MSLPFDPVVFVAPVAETLTSNDLKDSSSSKIVTNELSGVEAKEFYETVLCSASSSSNCSSKAIPKLLRNSQRKTNKISQNFQPDADVALKFSGNRLLLKSSAENNLEGIKQALKQGALIDCRDEFDWTPLICAAFENHVEAVKFLLDAGANFSLRNQMNESALDVAMKRRHYQVAYLLADMIDKDKKPNLSNLSGEESSSSSKTSKNRKIEKKLRCSECEVEHSDLISHKKSIIHRLKSSGKPPLKPYFGITRKNRGYQLLLRSGWNEESGLGISKSEGRKYPISTVLKRDRLGFGLKSAKPRITHFDPYDTEAIGGVPPAPKTISRRNQAKLAMIEKLKERDFRREFL